MRFLIPLAMALFAPPAAAQNSEDFASGCADDSGADRCSDAAMKAWRDRYNLPTIEKMADDGATVRRVLYVDGYGRDMMAISAVRAKGQPPIIEIRQPRRGKDAPVVRSRPIGETAWKGILTDSVSAHRQYRPEARSGDEDISICLHAWVIGFEAADPRRLAQFVVGQRWLDTESRSATASTCENGPIDIFSMKLADAAVGAFDECSGLDLARARNAVSLLNTCFGLSGDTVAAGHVLSVYRNLYPLIFRSVKAGESWTDILCSDSDLASQTLKKSPGIDWEGLRALFSNAHNVNFDIEETTGIDAHQVQMAATFNWSKNVSGTGDTKEPNRHSRKIQLIWIEETGNWRVNDIKLID